MLRCCICGRYIRHMDLITGAASYEFTPDNECGPERMLYFCAPCTDRQHQRALGKGYAAPITFRREDA